MILAFLVYLLVKPKRVEKSSTRTTRSTEASSSFADQPSNHSHSSGEKIPAERTISIEPVSDLTSVSNSRGDLFLLDSVSLFCLSDK